ncbi:HTH domain-containing protein [Enterococcus rivorum]|uniref:HTH domain-containing protein n=1 Tax=Enterococcus rivorum TaxID=762845 RepID=UPI003637A259
MIYGVESNIRRTTQLIHLLYYSKQPIAKEQILMQLEVSEQTLNKDINGIHETLTGITIAKETRCCA